jgi:hypothetical protein
LPAHAAQIINDNLRLHDKCWGRFNVRLSGRQPLLRLVASLMNLRSRLTGIATGDQAIFIHRNLFTTLGGFPDIEIMEDIALSKKLLSHGYQPLCLTQTVITSSRRWERCGILRTILLMWYLRLAYALGRPTTALAKKYSC